jgi:hypothetical protein
MLYARLVDPGIVHEPVERPVVVLENKVGADDRRLTAARGVAIGVLIALPFWALIAFTVYLLL